MAKRTESFNLSQTIRDFQKGNRGASAKEAFESIKKAHSDAKINEGTFKSTFYKLAAEGTRKSVKRRRPVRVHAGSNGRSESAMRAGLAFIRLAGSVENARQQLAELEELIETARSVR